MNPRRLLRGLILIATLLAIGYGLEVTHFGATINQAWIDHEIRGRGMQGELLFIAIGGIATALALPRQLISFLGAYAFGFAAGTVMALLATTLGCVLVFFYARWFGRRFVAKRFATQIQRIDDFLSWRPFAMTLLVRLLPVGHNLSTNLAAGVTRVPALPFLSGSLLGYIPQTVIFALVGSGINVDSGVRIGLAVTLLVVSSVIGVWLYRNYRHGHSLGAEVDDELDPTALANEPGGRRDARV